MATFPPAYGSARGDEEEASVPLTRTESPDDFAADAKARTSSRLTRARFLALGLAALATGALYGAHQKARAAQSVANLIDLDDDDPYLTYGGESCGSNCGDVELTWPSDVYVLGGGESDAPPTAAGPPAAAAIASRS